jgi:hypothetical protein
VGRDLDLVARTRPPRAMTDASLLENEREPDAPRSQLQSATRWARTRALATRHWPFLIVFGIGFALRVITQIAYRPALLFIDSYRYLELLHSFDPTRSQTLGYDFVLWPLLQVGNLFVVALVQHLLGLAIGVAIYVLCMRYGVSRWLAAAAAAPILLDAYQLQIEQNIMSETIFEALLVGAMLTLLWHRRPSTRALVIGGVLLGLAVPVRIVALPLVVPAAIFAFVSGPGGGRRLGRAAIVAVAFLVPVAGYMTYYRSQAGEFALSTTDAHATFGRAAQIARCDSLSLTPVERRLCPKEPIGQRRGVNYYAHHYPVRRLSGVPNGPILNKVLRDFARHVFRQQPLDLTHAVATDFLKGFRWQRTNAPNDVPVERWQFQTRWQYNEYHPLAATREWGGGPPTIVKPLASFLRGYQLSVGYTPGPLLFVAFVGGILGGCGVYRAGRSRLRAVCWLPTLTGVGVLVSADLFEFSWRYQLPMLVLAPIAGALGFTAIFRDPDAPYSLGHRRVGTSM